MLRHKFRPTPLSCLLLFCLVALSAGSAHSTGESPDYEDLRAIIEENRVLSIAELLSFLPPDYLSFYTLMHKSRGLQGASFQNPRAIIYGRQGKMVIAFNGDASQEGFHRLEVMQFRDETSEFEFRAIVFPDPSKNQSEIEFSERNPMKCSECHRSRLRPNWESYAEWPGAYGSDDDFLSLETPSAKLEYDKLMRFVETQSGHPRYRHLRNLKDGYKREDKILSRTRNRHNIQLNQRLGALNLKRVARFVVNSPDYPSYRYAVFSSIWCPPGRRDKYLPFPSKAPHFDSETGAFQFEPGFRQLFESRGIDTDDLFMNFERSGYSSFRTPAVPRRILTREILALDSDLSPYFHVVVWSDEYSYGYGFEFDYAEPKNMEKGTYYAPKSFCRKMRATSKIALAQLPRDRLPSQELYEKKVPRLLKKCMICHTGKQPLSGIPIPFHNDALLSKRFQADNAYLIERIKNRLSKRGRGQMPPSGSTMEDQDHLLGYLEALLGG